MKFFVKDFFSKCDQTCSFQASACNFIQKETLAHVSSYKFCKIFKNALFHRTPPVAISETTLFLSKMVGLYQQQYLIIMKIPFNTPISIQICYLQGLQSTETSYKIRNFLEFFLCKDPCQFKQLRNLL